MPMAQVTFSVPQSMVDFIETKNPHDELLRNAMMLYPYVQRQVISHGRAAELLGIHKFDLIDLYAEMGIPYFNQTVEEVEEDVRNLEMALGK